MRCHHEGEAIVPDRRLPAKSPLFVIKVTKGVVGRNQVAVLHRRCRPELMICMSDPVPPSMRASQRDLLIRLALVVPSVQPAVAASDNILCDAQALTAVIAVLAVLSVVTVRCNSPYTFVLASSDERGSEHRQLARFLRQYRADYLLSDAWFKTAIKIVCARSPSHEVSEYHAPPDASP